MTETIALPLWVVVAVGLLALWALYERVPDAGAALDDHAPGEPRLIEDVSTRLASASVVPARTKRQASSTACDGPKVRHAVGSFRATSDCRCRWCWKSWRIRAGNRRS
jgi:hypothetical protein